MTSQIFGSSVGGIKKLRECRLAEVAVVAHDREGRFVYEL